MRKKGEPIKGFKLLMNGSSIGFIYPNGSGYIFNQKTNKVLNGDIEQFFVNVQQQFKMGYVDLAAINKNLQEGFEFVLGYVGAN